MARKIWLTLGVIGIAVVLGFGMYQSNASNAEPTLAVADIEELVTSQYPGTITELELTKGTNGADYEVEIANDSVEYELEIDGESGEIINLKERLIAIKDQDNTEEHIDLKEKQEKEQKAKQKQQDEKDKNKEQLEKTQIEKKQNDKQKKKKESKSKHTVIDVNKAIDIARSEEHTSELQSRGQLVCRLLLEKKKTLIITRCITNYNVDCYICIYTSSLHCIIYYVQGFTIPFLDHLR